jgi:hypothetical protein
MTPSGIEPATFRLVAQCPLSNNSTFRLLSTPLQLSHTCYTNQELCTMPLVHCSVTYDLNIGQGLFPPVQLVHRLYKGEALCSLCSMNHLHLHYLETSRLHRANTFPLLTLSSPLMPCGVILFICP